MKTLDVLKTLKVMGQEEAERLGVTFAEGLLSIQGGSGVRDRALETILGHGIAAVRSEEDPRFIEALAEFSDGTYLVEPVADDVESVRTFLGY